MKYLVETRIIAPSKKHPDSGWYQSKLWDDAARFRIGDAIVTMLRYEMDKRANLIVSNNGFDIMVDGVSGRQANAIGHMLQNAATLLEVEVEVAVTETYGGTNE